MIAARESAHLAEQIIYANVPRSMRFAHTHRLE
jgi:hypothetical protein